MAAWTGLDRHLIVSVSPHYYSARLQSIDHFEDLGPSVVMASPGMMQSGLSRELFEDWCTDRKNGTIIAGYCVEGTLAKVGRAVLTTSDWTSAMSSDNLSCLWFFTTIVAFLLFKIIEC